MGKSGKYSKWILACMLIFLIIFVQECLYITLKTGTEPATIAALVFGFCGVEGGLMAWIKTVKVKGGKPPGKDRDC
jgi:hypothetical protein